MPQTMTTDGLTEANWQLAHRQTQQMSIDGRGNVLTFGPAFWLVDMTYTRLSESQFRTLQAQFNALDGRKDYMILWRPTRQNPVGFDASGAGGTVSAFAVNVANKTATVTASGGNLAAGDFVSYDAGTSGRYVGEVIAATNVTGTQTTVTLTPDPVTAAGTPNATIYRATGHFRVEELTMQEPIGTGSGSVKVRFKQITPEG